MKKTLKRAVATALAFSMVFGVLPTAYAADPTHELTKVTIGGVKFDFSVPMKPTYPAVTPATEPTYEDLRARTVTVHLTEEIAKDKTYNEVAPDVTGTTTADNDWFLAEDGYDTLTGALTVAGLEDKLEAYEPAVGAGVELKEGDIIVLKNSEEDASGYYAFKVSFGNTGAIEGENDVKNAALNVVLPTNLDFSLDPLELTDEQVKTTGSEAAGRIEGSQIKSADYAIINKTGAPVKVAFDLTVEGLEGVETQAEDEDGNALYLDEDGNVTTEDEDEEQNAYDPLYEYPGSVAFVNDPSEIDGKDNDAVTTKKIYMAAVGAANSSIIGGALSFTAPTNFSNSEFLYNYMVEDEEGNDVIAEAAAGFVVDDKLDINQAHKGGTSIAFALDAATDESADATDAPDTLAATNGGVTSFSLYGELNTYANWKGGDINLSGAYTLTALRNTSYDLMTTEEIDDPENTDTDIPNPDYKMAVGSLNVMKVASAEPVEPAGPNVDLVLVSGTEGDMGTISKANYSNGEAYTMFLTGKPADVTDVLYTLNGYKYAKGTNYTYDAETGVLSIKFLTMPNNGINGFTVDTATLDYTFKVNLTN